MRVEGKEGPGETLVVRGPVPVCLAVGSVASRDLLVPGRGEIECGWRCRQDMLKTGPPGLKDASKLHEVESFPRREDAFRSVDKPGPHLLLPRAEVPE